MDTRELIEQAERIKVNAGNNSLEGLAEAREFLRVYGGEKNSFYKLLENINPSLRSDLMYEHVIASLSAYINYIKNGLNVGISIERKAQLDIVSDLLDQANALLNNEKMHPAAPIIIIGSSLEEFLRIWVEEASLSLDSQKPSIKAYGNVLKEANLISKQDIRDITSWIALIYHAAVGDWDEFSDKSRVSLMLDGVNLFMRKYG